MAYETILYEEDGPVGTLTLNRPDDGNMFTPVNVPRGARLHRRDPARDAHARARHHRCRRPLFLHRRPQGGNGGHPPLRRRPADSRHVRGDRAPAKAVIASVNGYAVDGGNVLQVMCDITIAKESAIFRQVGPMMGSFDAGFGTWYLEDLVGKKKAKEIWFRNPRLSAREALELGMINRVVPDDRLKQATRDMALEIAERGAVALASIKTAFSARHGGVGGLARLAHDLLLRQYLDSEESHELGPAFAARRTPDPDKFGH